MNRSELDRFRPISCAVTHDRYGSPIAADDDVNQFSSFCNDNCSKTSSREIYRTTAAIGQISMRSSHPIVDNDDRNQRVLVLVFVIFLFLFLYR